MHDTIKEAILELSSRAKTSNQDSGADKALKFSQAAQNLAHAGSILLTTEIQRDEKKKKAGAS